MNAVDDRLDVELQECTLVIEEREVGGLRGEGRETLDSGHSGGGRLGSLVRMCVKRLWRASSVAGREGRIADVRLGNLEGWYMLEGRVMESLLVGSLWLPLRWRFGLWKWEATLSATAEVCEGTLMRKRDDALRKRSCPCCAEEVL